MPGALLKRYKRFLQQWCGTGNKDAHVSRNVGGEIRIVQQAGVVRWHSHHHAAFGQAMNDGGRVIGI